jgi:hypothetical protein
MTGEVRQVVWWSGPDLGSYHLEEVIWLLFEKITLVRIMVLTGG